MKYVLDQKDVHEVSAVQCENGLDVEISIKVQANSKPISFELNIDELEILIAGLRKGYTPDERGG